MPITNSQPSPNITPVVSFPTPRGRCDLAFYEVRRGLSPANRLWAYGDKHPNSKQYPHHELVAVTPQDHEWERWYYAAERADQENYNWEYSEQAEWETLTQTFLVKRCDLSLDPANYPAPPTDLFDSTDYEVTSVDQGEIRDQTLESLYVMVRVRREKILNNPRTASKLDQQTNTLRTVTIEKVPAGTPGSVVDATGQYSEVQSINSRWAIKTTQFMAGLAGNGDDAFQQWEAVINYSWPDVLDYINYFTFPSSSGSVKSYTGRPVWKRQRYDGPCQARITERWTKELDTPPTLVPMLPREIQYSSPLLNVNIGPCLHDFVPIFHSSGTQHPTYGYYGYYEEYEATTLLDWPEVHIASYTVTPAMGGYLSKLVEVFRPDGVLFDNYLRLAPPQQGSASGTIELSWSLENQVGTLSQYRLDVCTNPEFAGTFLTGFNNKNVGTATSYTVPGLQIGVPYFIRVRAVMTTPTALVVSNSQMALAATVSSYTVFVNPQLFDGDTVDYGTVNVGGTPVVKTLTINNTGNVALSIPSATLSGTDSEYWTVTGPSLTTIPVAGSATVGLTFEPDTERSYSGAVSLDLTNAEPMNLVLTGSAGVPGISFTFRDVAASSGDTVNYDVDSQTGTLVISNPGTANLTISNISLTGTDADQWSLSPEFLDPITVLPGDSTSITVTYVPDEASAGHTAALNIAHDGGGSPFVLNLFGQAEIASLGFEWPSGTDQSYGFAIDLYATEGSPGTPVTETLVLKASGGIVPISIPSITISGTNSTMFSIVGQEGAPTSSITIPAGSSYTYDVTFDPGSSGIADYFGQLDFDHNDPDITQPAAISLVGHISSY